MSGMSRRYARVRHRRTGVAAFVALAVASMTIVAGGGDEAAFGSGSVVVPDTMTRETSVRGSSPGVVFRWRADGVESSAGTMQGSPAANSSLRRGAASGADEFTNMTVGNFDGINDGFEAASASPVQSTTGFTAMAWFRASETSGIRTLYSDQESGGIALDVKNDYVRLQVADQTGSYRELADTSTPIGTQKWYFVAAVVRISGSTTTARLYIDHKLVAESAIPGMTSIKNSGETGCVAAECNKRGATRAPLDEFFAGQINAVVVLNYPVENDAIAPVYPSDGGRYLGQPSFHDDIAAPESAGTAGAPWYYSNRTYNPFRRVIDTDRDPAYPQMNKVRTRIGIPYLNDNYVPQGMGLSDDGQTMWLGMYYKNYAQWNATPKYNAAGFGSIVVKIDLATQRVNTVYRLRDAAGGPLALHATGVQFAGGYIWMGLDGSSAPGTLYRFDPSVTTVLDPGDASRGSPPILDVRVNAQYATNIQADGVFSYDADRHALWIMDTISHELSFYELDAAAVPGVSPVETFRIPDAAWATMFGSGKPVSCWMGGNYLQGGHAYSGRAVGDNVFLFTGSCGGVNPTEVWQWCQDPATCAPTLLAKLSPGGQEIDIAPDGTVWVFTELGSRYYQGRGSGEKLNPWLGFTPYVMGIDKAAIGAP